MDAAVQIDLAREEATVRQVLDSPLESHSEHLAVLNLGTETTSDGADRRSKRSARGAMVTASQVRLKPISPSRGPHDSRRSPSPGVDDRGRFAETEKVVELQPIDKGFGAWSYVAATFAMYIVVWGFPYSFPIFQTYLSTGPKALYPNSIAIRLLAPGIQDILEGMLFPILPASSRYRRTLVLIGIVIITVSLILASYAKAAWQVVVTQGVSFGIGGILMNYVHVSIFSEWFDKKKGTAMGIIWTGWRVGALAFPLICQWLLDQHGFARTIRVLLPPMLTLLAPAIVLLRGRYHDATVSVQPQKPTMSKLQAMRAPAVLYYLLATNLYFLVVNLPKMFITTFAADLKLSGSTQAGALVILTLSEMLVTYLCGWMSDRHHHGFMMGSLAILTSIIHVLGLGFARSRVSVFAYAILVGCASGGFSNFLFTFYGDASRGSGELFTAIHGLFSLFRGMSILSVGPVGAELLRHAPSVDTETFAIGRYKNMVVYAGSLSFTSGVLLLGKAAWPRQSPEKLPSPP